MHILEQTKNGHTSLVLDQNKNPKLFFTLENVKAFCQEQFDASGADDPMIDDEGVVVGWYTDVYDISFNYRLCK